MNTHKIRNTSLYVSFRRIFPILVKIALVIIIANICTTSSHAQPYDVCPSGCPFSAIQDAIDHAISGDTITISEGTYAEHLTITNTDPASILELTLVGAGADLTIVDGSARDVVLRVGANTDVTLSGMTIQNGATPGYFEGESWKKGSETVYNDENIDTNFEFLTGEPPNAILTYTGWKESLSAVWGQSFKTSEDTAPQPIIGFRFFEADGLTATGAGTGYLFKDFLPSSKIEDVPKFSLASGDWNGSYYDLYDPSGNRLQAEPGQRYIFISLSDNPFEVGVTNIGWNPGAGIANSGDLHLFGVHVEDNDTLLSGGGIWNNGNLTMEDSEVSWNEAQERGGGIFNVDASGYLGEVLPTLNITNSLIKNNAAHGSGLAGAGGGIYVGQDGNLHISGSTISGNSSPVGGGISTDGSWSTVVTHIENCEITNNSAVMGGGVFNFNGSMSIFSSTIQLNTAERMGGGVVNSPHPRGIANLDLADSAVRYNQVTDAQFMLDGGGGIYNGQAFPDLDKRSEPALATIRNSTINNNSTNDKSGGGIMATSCATMIENSTISGNSAPQGAGITFEVYFYDYMRCIPEPWLNILSSTITQNHGGGLYYNQIDRSSFNLMNSIIGGNDSYDCTGPLTTQGGNLDSDHTCSLSNEIDIPGEDPRLGPLQDKGGPTLTHKPLPGSPVIDPFYTGYPGGDTYLSSGGAFHFEEGADVDFQIFINPVAPDLLLENLIGTGDNYNFIGQSFSIPNDAMELELSGFRFMRSDHVTPSGAGTGYLFTEEYLGAPSELINADFVASAEWDDVDKVYDFSNSGYTIIPGKKYWFYSDTPLEAGASTTQDCGTSVDQRYIPRPLDGNADGVAACDIGSVEVSVPIANPGGPYTGDEGSTIQLDGTQSSDPEGDELTYSWSVDTPLCGFDDATSPSPSITCSDNGSFTVTLVVNDGDTSSSNTATLSVNNVAPIGSIVDVPSTLLAAGDLTAEGNFSDPGMSDTHTAEWDWGDGSISAGTISELNVGPDSHAYNVPGIYTIKLTVSDDDGGIGMSEFDYAVVYDPDDSFVTGGGWIVSPEGAYKADPTLTGKADFGFVSKYKKGASVPTGNTEFQFHAADLNFHSTSYDWLVVTGSNYARFKGSGTINGVGDFKFMLWARDDEPDTFRIKIWQEDDDGIETVVYDNGFDQEIAGGSIVIHTQK